MLKLHFLISITEESSKSDKQCYYHPTITSFTTNTFFIIQLQLKIIYSYIKFIIISKSQNSYPKPFIYLFFFLENHMDNNKIK